MTFKTEQLWIGENDNIERLCHLSKNLYNEANYVIRQEFFSTRKWIHYNNIYQLLKNSENYKSLPAQSAQQTLKLLDKNWKSFFNSMKEWEMHPDKFKEKPRIPSYRKKDGLFILMFTNQQAKIKNGWLHLPKKILSVKTRLSNLHQVRIIPKGVGYVLEIIYEKIIKAVQRNRDRVVGIDFGVRNIVTMVNNIGEEPIVVKGGVVKSMNQYFNKRKGELQSVYDLQGIKEGKKLRKLSVKRERKLHDALHKISRFVIDWCVDHNIGTLVIGYNEDWKQGINLGKRINQSFVSIPYYKLKRMLEYKGEDVGINVIAQEESHTSKCSFLDNESVKHHNKYVGKRSSRGLFRSANGTLINADVNGGYNIVKKAVLNAFRKLDVDEIEGVGLHPRRCVNIF